MAVLQIVGQREMAEAGRLAFGLGELSESLGVSVDSLGRAIRAGRLRVVRIGGRVLVPKDEVQRILSVGLEIPRGRPRKQRPDPADRKGGGAETKAE